MSGVARGCAALLLTLAACGPGVEDPSCWEGGGGTLTVPPLAVGSADTLKLSLRNGCDRPLHVSRLSLTDIRCEQACPVVTLGAVPDLPRPVPAGGTFDLDLDARANGGTGRTELLLTVTTGEVDAPEIQVWNVVAESQAP
jgi:hypothetical protein